MARTVHPADLGFFSMLVHSGSLTAAARELGLTTPAVSKRLSQIEARLGTALVTRTTRRMGLTPEGEIYLENARRILGEIETMEQQLLGLTQEPQGTVRVNATLGFGRSHIAPLLSQFVRKHPKVEVQLQLSVNPPALTDDAYDVCFRFGHPPDSRGIARFIAPNRRVLVASPAYLKRHGAPATPRDLARHNCIGIRQGDEAYGQWRFTSLRGGRAAEQAQTVKIRGNLTTNDGGIAVSWALEGHGILLRAEWDVQRYLASGRLVQVLPDHGSPDADIYAVYSQQHRSSVRVKAVVDFVAAAFDEDRTRRGP
ncbi:MULTISPECIES: LysR family transcriptional regulator [Ramlibacter]|uniref:LysR family transcriptional regulator n=1 Tax=Ramlibacter pinisoli TaxID=2682844 RepID=A0A6N8IR97_9BURK|nr:MULTISPECIES: LysR family transcriptional regulator [Ramlibacter]MBA2964276.1 LysR family transcriptional regulator [Ramlibacter sp. CGMCC 1.13660]MVQ29242.1 LysR family transcriptional regulator [Ramlibacter pinisoli]